MTTGVLVLVLRLALAGVLAVAALAKLTDRRALRETVVAFGVPQRLAAGAILVPVLELGLVALLLPARTAWAGAIGALALLAIFTTAIAAQLARGRRPACNCFGAARATPIGPLTLVRNAVLLAGAATVVVLGRDEPGASIAGWSADPAHAAIAGLGLLAACLAAALVVVLRRHGQVLLRLDELEAGIEPRRPGLPLGSDAPWFELPGVEAAPVTLTDLRAHGLPVLLLFTHPGCGPCISLLPDVGRWQRAHGDELVVALVSSGTAADARAHATEHGLEHVVLDDGAVADAYEVRGTPTAVVVDPRGHVASEPAVGAVAIAALVSGLVEQVREEAMAGV